MEDKEGISPSGVTVKGDEAPDSYCIVPRTENQNTNPNPPFLGPTTVVAPPTTTVAPPPVSSVTPPSGSGLSTEMIKKKRGRPRKYGPDGTLTAAAAAATLSPMPISSSIPLAGDFSGWKRGRGRSIESVKKSQKFDFESSGGRLAYFVGANFMPHVISVNAGEDVTMKVMSFSQQGSHAVCILSANGTISNVTLRQPTTSGGTLTYEGRFEILSLSGSFMPTENGGTRGRSGGMSVSLAGPDGRVVGGGLAGLLVAAGPVQVIVGSFILGHQAEHKQKKQRAIEPAPPPAFTITTVNPISAIEPKQPYGGTKPTQAPSSFRIENPVCSAKPAVQGYTTNSNADNNNSESSSLGDESGGTNSQSNCELSS